MDVSPETPAPGTQNPGSTPNLMPSTLGLDVVAKYQKNRLRVVRVFRYVLHAPKCEHIVRILKLYAWSPARSKVTW